MRNSTNNVNNGTSLEILIVESGVVFRIFVTIKTDNHLHIDFQEVVLGYVCRSAVLYIWQRKVKNELVLAS